MKLNMFKKILLSFLTSILVLVTIAPYFSPARAQGLPDTWYAPEFGTYVDRVYDESNPEEIFGERYTHAQVVWILHSLTAVLLPEFVITCMTIDDPADAGSCFFGAWAAITAVFDYSPRNTNFASTFNSLVSENRISGVGYFKELAEKFHIVREAKAQGFGFDNLSPIRQVWSAIRDISYFLLIFAFIVMAFMIMFRVRISPQTVITVQSALPRLILILILITFSYAIAGFVVDLAYLTLGLVAILGSNLSDLTTLELFSTLITSLPIISMFMIPFIVSFYFIVHPSVLGALFSAPIIILGAIISIILFILLLIIAIRMLWLLIKTFINVVILIAAAPLLILFGVFPAAGGFSTWLRNLASHVLVFPAVISLVFLAHYVFWSSLSDGTWLSTFFSSDDSLNPYRIPTSTNTGTIELPGFNLGDSTLFGAIVAIGIITLVPAVGSIIQGFISGRPFAYGTAIGQAVGPIGAAWGSGPISGVRKELSFQSGAAMASGLADSRVGRWLPQSWSTALRNVGRSRS